MPSEADNDAMLEALRNGDQTACGRLLSKDAALSNAMNSVREKEHNTKQQ